MFDDEGERTRPFKLADDVLGYVASASLSTRFALLAALYLLSLAPLLLFASLRPLALLDRERRRAVLTRLEGTALGLVFVPWRALFVMHFYEDDTALARIGYREERRRHLDVLAPVPSESGVRLKDVPSEPLEAATEIEEEKGVA